MWRYLPTSLRLMLLFAAAVFGCAGCSPQASTSVDIPSPTPEVECIPWYEAPNHIGETTCVEGRILQVRDVDTPRPRIAFFIFDPEFSDFHFVYGKFHAFVHSDDWCEYFPHCRQRPYRSELDGTCARVFGTIEIKWGSRIRIEVTDREQMELIDCAACQSADACSDPWTEPPIIGDKGVVLLVVTPRGFNDDEYSYVRRTLRSAGYTVLIASISRETAVGDYGLIQVEPDLSLTDVDGASYDAIIFVGGRGALAYADDAGMWRVAQEALDRGRVVAAATTAPVILARAGVLEGKAATVYDPATNCPALEANGATCTEERVERDGQIVTSRSEQAIQELVQIVVGILEER